MYIYIYIYIKICICTTALRTGRTQNASCIFQGFVEGGLEHEHVSLHVECILKSLPTKKAPGRRSATNFGMVPWKVVWKGWWLYIQYVCCSRENMFFLVQDGAGFSSQKKQLQNKICRNRTSVGSLNNLFTPSFDVRLKQGNSWCTCMHWKRSSLADFRMRYYIQLGMQSFSCLYMILADTHTQTVIDI